MVAVIVTLRPHASRLLECAAANEGSFIEWFSTHRLIPAEHEKTEEDTPLDMMRLFVLERRLRNGPPLSDQKKTTFCS